MTPEALVTAMVAVIGTLGSVIAFLGRDLIRQRDLALSGWRVQTEANLKLAAAWEARNRRDERSSRQDDPA